MIRICTCAYIHMHYDKGLCYSTSTSVKQDLFLVCETLKSHHPIRLIGFSQIITHTSLVVIVTMATAYEHDLPVLKHVCVSITVV